MQNILLSIDGSKSSTPYTDITNTWTNLTLLCSFTNATIGACTDVSIRNADVFQYIHLFHENTVNGVSCNIHIVTGNGSFQMIRLEGWLLPATQGTDYSITTDAVTRSATIPWLGSATRITYDMTVLCFEELFNRICQVVYNYFTIKINYWSITKF